MLVEAFRRCGAAWIRLVGNARAWRAGVWLAALLSLSASMLYAEPSSRSVAAGVDIELFTRAGCPRCAAAHDYVERLSAAHPELTVVTSDVSAEPAALERLESLARRTRQSGVGVPSFDVRGTLIVGFISPESTGARIEALLNAPPGSSSGEDRTAAPGEAATCPAEGPLGCPEPDDAPASVDLPWLGPVSAGDLGLPLFTLAVGLVDGFNPCAMWVLLFLLSVLAGLSDRKKLLLVAGVFVLVSALAYYLFMLAWLNAFMLLGVSTLIQRLIGVVGLVIGAIHVKDFFAFGKGVSLSIPERQKPGIYARVRSIAHAKSAWLAVSGAAVLAVLVNGIELLCTAGLPALYTQVLVSRALLPWQHYAYLALYDLAYMFDDAIMVGIAVVTLSRHKLQERGGRFLKLLSGCVTLALGAVLTFKPEWLQL